MAVPHSPPIELRSEGLSLLKNEDVMAGVPAASWEAMRMRAIPRDWGGAWVPEDIVEPPY